MKQLSLTCMKTVADAGMMSALVVSRLSKLCLRAGISPDVSNPAHSKKAMYAVLSLKASRHQHSQYRPWQTAVIVEARG